MKIKTTLTLQYAGLTAAVFFVFVIAVYYVSEHHAVMLSFVTYKVKL